MKQETKVANSQEAIVTYSRGHLTYAEILKKVKSDPDLKDLGENVSKIRSFLGPPSHVLAEKIQGRGKLTAFLNKL